MLEVPRKLIGMQVKLARFVAERVAGRGAEAQGPASPAAGPGSAPSEGGRDASPAVAKAAEPGARARIVFEGLGIDREVQPGTTVLEAAIAADVHLNHYCGGMSSCGSCRVEVVAGVETLSPLDAFEMPTLDMVKENPDDRLGCQARILGPCTVRIPPQE